MGKILIHVKTGKSALELLLYVYQNQIHLGKEHLSLVIKHDDGMIERSRGSINHVFKSETIHAMEVEDLVLLEHSDNLSTSFEEASLSELSCDSVETLLNATKNIDQCCSFIFPPSNNIVFFAIKNHPMVRYILFGNEVISDLTYGRKSSVINNMCGELNTRKGLILMKSTNQR